MVQDRTLIDCSTKSRDFMNRQIEKIVMLLNYEPLNLRTFYCFWLLVFYFSIFAALYNLCAAPPLRTTHYAFLILLLLC